MKAKVSILMGLIVAIALTFVNESVMAQASVKNPSSSMSVEISIGRDAMILSPSETKSVYFIPANGVVRNVRLRYALGADIRASFTTDITTNGSTLVLPIEKPAPPKPETAESKNEVSTSGNSSGGSSSSSQDGEMQGFAPVIPEVSGTVAIDVFPLILCDSSGQSILVFDGDFYGVALNDGQQSKPITTKPGMISLKILYDADPVKTSTGKNIWQTPITGIVTQDQKYFVVRPAHLQNIQRSLSKVIFYNPTPFTMVCDDPTISIDPIAPNGRSKKIKLNQGFNNLSFSYINAQGVKVRAVFELVVSSGKPAVALQLNPLGQAYGVNQATSKKNR